MLSDVDVERCGQVAAALGQWATQRIGRQRPTPEQTSTKAHAADWVTTVDVAVEEHVRAELGRHFPDHAIIGEELGGDEPADGRPRWYLDPIDGTTNFVHGLPRYSFSLAVADEAGIAVGVVADPSSGEILQAGRDRGATLDGKRVRCSPATTLVGGIVCVELAGYRCWPGLTDLLGQLEQRRCVTRILGSSALSLASVGAGRAAGVIFGASHPIDVAAGVLIAVEGGARVIAGDGTHPALGAHARLERPGLAVVAPGVADELVDIWAHLATT